MESSESDTIETLEERYWDIQSHGNYFNCARAWRGGNPGAVNPQCRSRKRALRLARSRTVVQTPIGGRAGSIDGDAYPPNRTKNVQEFQLAVMQWELTFVELESCLKSSLRGLSITESFAFGRTLPWKRSWLNRSRTLEFNLWSLGISKNPAKTMRMSMRVQHRQR